MERKRTATEQAKAEALAKSLVTAWSTQVDDENMEAAESSMLKMAKEFPRSLRSSSASRTTPRRSTLRGVRRLPPRRRALRPSSRRTSTR